MRKVEHRNQILASEFPFREGGTVFNNRANSGAISFGGGSMSRYVDALGMKFNRLTVISFQGVVKERATWLCRCECGNTTVVPYYHLKSGNTTSCGCYKRSNEQKVVHGMARHKGRASIYHTWAGIIKRCLNANDKNFPDYGGRGIRVCERWLSFVNFMEDMGPKPQGMTIERKNNNGDYKPNNCKWATRAEQNRNTRASVWLTHDNKTMILADWSRHYHRSKATLQYHIKKRGVDGMFTYMDSFN